MMLGIGVPLFAATVWILIGGLLSILAPCVILSFSFYTQTGKDRQTPRPTCCPKAVGHSETPRSTVGPQFIADAKSKDKGKVSQADDDEVMNPNMRTRGIPAYLGTRERAEEMRRRPAGHRALNRRPFVKRQRRRSRCHPVPRELDLFMDEPPSLTVVLDLDETLVRSCEYDAVPVHLEFAALMGKLIKLDVECLGGSHSYTRVVSFLRPGLFEFLERVSRLADVYIFTAGDPDYARPLVQLLDQEGKVFLGSYYRDTTVATTLHDHVKDLTRLGFDLTRTVLVDNNPYSFLLQPDNGILCESFYGEPEDRHLLNVILPSLQLLARVPDVRPILRRRYNLAGWCQTLENWYY